MTKVSKISVPKIYFFENGGSNLITNSLKEFIYFLKYQGHSVIDFSYSNGEDTLHRNLNIKRNFELDAIPKSLIKDSENNLTDFLNDLENPYLKELISDLGDLSKTINELKPFEIKLASVIKAVLSPSYYIFLDSPEKSLTPETMSKLKNCIYYEANVEERVVLMKSDRRILWPDIVSNIISKDEKHRYHNIKNPLNSNSKIGLHFKNTRKSTSKKAS